MFRTRSRRHHKKRQDLGEGQNIKERGMDLGRCSHGGATEGEGRQERER